MQVLLALKSFNFVYQVHPLLTIIYSFPTIIVSVLLNEILTPILVQESLRFASCVKSRSTLDFFITPSLLLGAIANLYNNNNIVIVWIDQIMELIAI